MTVGLWKHWLKEMMVYLNIFFLLTVFYHIFCTFVCHVFTGPHREWKKKKKKSYESRFCTSQQNNNTNGRKMRIGKCPWYQGGDNWIPQFLLHPVTKLRIMNSFIKTLVKGINRIKQFFSVISVLSLLLYERAEEEEEEELWGQILHIIAKH